MTLPNNATNSEDEDNEKEDGIIDKSFDVFLISY